MDLIDRERLGSGYLPPWVLHEHQARWEFAADLVRGKQVVDCACGVGEGTAVLAASAPKSVHAFDLSADAVASASQRCEKFGCVVVRQANAESLPLAPESVEIFVSLETIEHIDAAEKFLEEVVRTLTDGGSFVCSTPNRRITMPGKSLSDRPWNPFHVREYSDQEFVQLLREYFNEVEIFGQNQRPEWCVRVLEAIGKVLPGNLGGRLNSALKLPRYLMDSPIRYRVKKMRSGVCGEYLVVVCKQPRKPGARRLSSDEG